MADTGKIDRLLQEATQAMQANRPKQAIRLARQVLDIAPQNAPALFVSGMAEQARGRKDVALNFMQMAIKANPNVPEIQFNLGVLLGLNGRTVESETVFREMMKLHLVDAYAKKLELVGKRLAEEREGVHMSKLPSFSSMF